MIWYIFYGIAFAALIFTILTVILSHLKRIKTNVSKLYLLLACCFAMAVMLCIPPLYFIHRTDDMWLLKTIVFSVQKAVRIFGADEIYDILEDAAEDIPAALENCYEFTMLTVQFVAPILTFGFVISFFKNLIPYILFKAMFWKKANVFSGINDKNIVLAKSIAAKEKTDSLKKWFFRPIIVFTNVGKEEEENTELLEEAKEIDALLFHSDLENIHFKSRILKRKMDFYLIDDDVNRLIRQATTVIREYDEPEISLFVFTEGKECELLLSAWDNKNMKVFRINPSQALIYHNLHEYGIRIFKNAWNFNDRTISAILAGMDQYGLEMLKALIWYCQMQKFCLKINVVDENEDAEKNFRMQCPEIMDKNRDTTEGEAHYDITFHSGVKPLTSDFSDIFVKIPDATYIFVSLGNDDVNINAASHLRALYHRINPAYIPDIETIVNDSNISRKMGITWGAGQEDDVGGLCNFKQQAYRIHMIGDHDHLFAAETLIDSELIEKGLEVHLRWANHNDSENLAAEKKKFWKYDYHFRSSLAKALHEDLRKKLIQCGYIEEIPGIYKEWDSRSNEEKLAIGKVEHVRWNAYMRTEGYRHAEYRYDLAKLHNNLVPVGDLTDDDLRKDA